MTSINKKSNNIDQVYYVGAGINVYQHSKIRNLVYAVPDILAVEALIRDNLPGAQTDTLLDNEATAANIRDAFQKALAEIDSREGENSVAIFQYAGHGTRDHHLATHDSTLSQKGNPNVLLHVDEVINIVQSCRAQLTLLILDCCFAGGVPQRLLEGLRTFENIESLMQRDIVRPPSKLEDFQGEGKIILCAAAPHQPAFETRNTQHGLLTGSLIESLQGDNAETKINIMNIVAETIRKVQAITKKKGFDQTPVYFGHTQGVVTFPTLKPGALFFERFPNSRHSIREEQKNHRFHFNMPVSEPLFVNQAKTLQALHDSFDDPDTHVCTLTDIAGTGKSTIARKWYDELIAKGISHRDIFWWGFEQDDSFEGFLDQLLLYLAPHLNIRDFDNWQQKRDIVHNFAQKQPFTLILDAFEVMQIQEETDDTFAAIKDNRLINLLNFIGEIPNQGLIVITSRYPFPDFKAMDGVGMRTLDAEQLNFSDARKLLRALGVKGDDKALNEIATQVECHIQSLRILGSYLVDLFEGDSAQANELLPLGSHKGIATKLTRVLEEYAKHLTPAQLCVLQIFSVFNKNIEESELNHFFRAKQEDSKFNTSLTDLSTLDFKLLLNNLIKRGLVTREQNGTYTCHSLIKNHFNQKLTEQEKHRIRQAIINYYHQHLSTKEDFEQQDIKPAKECVLHALEIDNTDIAVDIGGKLLVILFNLEEYQQGIDIGKKINKHLSEPKDNEEYINYLYHFACVLIEMEEYQAAKNMMEDCLRLTEAVEKDNNNLKSKIHNALGQIESVQNNSDAARQHLERALKEAVNDEPALTAAIYNNLGNVFKGTEDYTEAVAMYKKSIETPEGDEHPKSVAICIINLGSALYKLERLKEASDCYKKAHAVLMENNLENSSTMSGLLNNWSSGDLVTEAAAIENYKKALEIRRSIYGPRHVNTAKILYALGNVYRHLDHKEEAFKCYEEALDIYREVCEQDDPIMVENYYNLGEGYFQKEDQKTALTYFQNALRCLQLAKEPNPKKVADCYRYITQCYINLEDYKTALPYAQASLKKHQEAYEETDKELAECHKQYADCLTIGEGNIKKGMHYYNKVLEAYAGNSFEIDDMLKWTFDFLIVYYKGMNITKKKEIKQFIDFIQKAQDMNLFTKEYRNDEILFLIEQAKLQYSIGHIQEAIATLEQTLIIAINEFGPQDECVHGIKIAIEIYKNQKSSERRKKSKQKKKKPKKH